MFIPRGLADACALRWLALFVFKASGLPHPAHRFMSDAALGKVAIFHLADDGHDYKVVKCIIFIASCLTRSEKQMKLTR